MLFQVTVLDEENKLYIYEETEKAAEQSNCTLNELSKNKSQLQVDQRKKMIKTNFLKMQESPITMEQVDVLEKVIAPKRSRLAALSSANLCSILH